MVDIDGLLRENEQLRVDLERLRNEVHRAEQGLHSKHFGEVDGEEFEQLKGRISELEHYTSTACQHGQHEECRKECKFCGMSCRCRCHHVVLGE